MTCIVGLEHPGGVVVGGDSYLGDDDWRDLSDRPKWFMRGRYLLIASAGDFYPAQVAEYIAQFRSQRKRESDLHYLIHGVVEPIKLCHEQHQAVKKESNVTTMLVYNGKAYTMMPDYGLMRSSHGYAVIGSGERWAQGSLASTEDEPRIRVKKALDAAAKHSSQVNRPFTYAEVPLVNG